jgi:hypothetical protein
MHSGCLTRPHMQLDLDAAIVREYLDRAMEDE